MLDFIVKWGPVVLAVVGAASLAAAGLKPALDKLQEVVDQTDNEVDNKLLAVVMKMVAGLVWIGGNLLPVLNRLAMNPKSEA